MLNKSKRKLFKAQRQVSKNSKAQWPIECFGKWFSMFVCPFLSEWLVFFPTIQILLLPLLFRGRSVICCNWSTMSTTISETLETTPSILCNGFEFFMNWILKLRKQIRPFRHLFCKFLLFLSVLTFLLQQTILFFSLF